MKKNIILPIVSAILVAVVAVVVSEIIIRSEKNIWCDAGAVRASLGGDEKFITTSEPETYDLVYSRAELLSLCKKYENHYLSEDRIDCDCKLCARLDGYDDDYFKDKALIIYQQCIGRGSMFAINQIYVSEYGTLVLSLYDALSLYDEMHSDIDVNISKIYLGANVTQIGEYAFYDCRQVTDLELPSGLQTIEDYAFYNIGISELLIPAELRYVGQRAFCGASLRSIVVSAGNENYLQGVNCLVRKEDNYLLIGASDGIIPNGVTTIGVSAYSENMLMTSVNIPNTVTVIDHNAFIGCEGLTSVNIPSSVTEINSYAFAGCTNLAQITFGANSALTSIGLRAFMSCAISSIALPQRLTTIGESAFLQTELSSITIPVSVTTIDSAAFSYCDNLETIRLLRPYTNKTDYNFLTTGTNSSSAYPSLKEITVPDIESYSGYYLMFKYDDSDVEDILFIYGATNGQANVGLKYTIQSDGTYIISGYNSNLVGAKVLPTTYNGKPVNKIGSNAFSDCVSLTGVVIPSSITAIGSQAFKDCSGLKAITFNRTAAQGITQIETDSFAGCSAIEVINVPDEDSFNAYGMQFIEKDMNLLNALMGDIMLI